MKLKDKVIVVTGGTGVLGDSFNKAIAKEGGTVCILGRNIDKARDRADNINNNGGNALPLGVDVLNTQHLEKAVETIVATYGRIDGLVNAAGGNQPKAVIQPEDDIFSIEMEALRKVMDVNLFGTLLPTQIIGKAIVATSGKGSIVNISSVSASTVITKVLGYSMAKAAIENYTKWFAVELAQRYGGNLRMNAIMPGFFLTEQNKTLLTKEDGSLTERGQKVITKTPMQRFGKPEELCAALIYLLSDDSSFVLGSILEVDGGFTSFSGV
jgi:NAD(P)-dependent dehydrogenase (short-subunit alcohol dehydrogenase family)